MTPDYYTLLGVSRGAEAEIIRAAYLALARRYHPDAATAASPHDAEKFRLITEAYEVLRDPRRREYYDWGHSRQEHDLDEPEQWARPQEEQAHRNVRVPGKSRWSSAAAKPLVYSAGAIALVVALGFGFVRVIFPDGPSADTDLAMRAEKSEPSSSAMNDKVALQELTDLRRTLQQTERLAAANCWPRCGPAARISRSSSRRVAKVTKCWRRSGPAFRSSRSRSQPVVTATRCWPRS